jgi:predicted TPR repeat methyltransferase
MNQMPHPALTEARQCLSRGDQSGALDALNRGLEQSPADRLLLRTRAHLCIAQNNIPQATQDLDQAIGLYPEDAESLDDRGVLYQWQHNYTQAAEYHLRASEIDLRDGYLLNLAIALSYIGEKNKSRTLYGDVLKLNPNNTRAMTNLAILHDELGEYQEAADLLAQAHALGDQSFELCMAYGNACRHLDRRDEAVNWYEKALNQRPDNPTARFILSTLRGENPDAPPSEHVASLFDSYADNFEMSLVEKLRYRVPEILLELLRPELQMLADIYAHLNAIDLGAGTGLFGKLIRPYVQTSVGLDVSSKMLAKAQEQAIYDDVVCADIIKGLTQYPAKYFHLISSADVFVYIGKLDDIFVKVHQSLAEGGLFAYSTEALIENEQGDFVARETGRYAHSEAYLKKLARENGFKPIAFESLWIRYNKDKPLDGFIVVLKK